MNALVTGATGFVGSFLTEALVRKGYAVTCLVRKTSDLRWIRHFNVRFLSADLFDRDAYAAELRTFDYIFHVAGLTKADSADSFFQVNAEYTRVLIAAAAEAGPRLKRFLFVSSLAAAGPSLDGRPLSEEADSHPVSAYGRSKLEGEKAVMAYRDRVAITIVRPPAVYGPRDTDFFLVFKAVQNGIVPYWGKCTYSVIYVEDLVRGIILSVEKEEAAGNTYYLADSAVYTNDDLLDALSVTLDRKVFRLRLPRSLLPVLAAVIQKIPKKGIINPDKIQEIRYENWTCSPAKALKDLGFRTDIPLGEGFRKTADWYRKEKWL